MCPWGGGDDNLQAVFIAYSPFHASRNRLIFALHYSVLPMISLTKTSSKIINSFLAPGNLASCSTLVSLLTTVIAQKLTHKALKDYLGYY